MNSNVLQFPVTWTDPQIKALQRIGATYLATWHKQRYAFLPRLHELLERHARLFIKSVEDFHSNAERVSSRIRAGALDQLAQDIDPDDDPLDIAEYLEVAQDAVVEIAGALSRQMDQLKSALRDTAALGVYDTTRDASRYKDELAKLERDQPARESELQARQAELASLDEAIGVLQAARIDQTFQGQLPTAQQLKEAASLIASGGVSVEAVENALKRIGELIGTVLEGMRYTAILDQRRDRQKAVDGVLADLRSMEKQKRDTQDYCARLAEYPSLVEQREEWRAAFNQIVEQLEPVCKHLVGYRITTVQALSAVLSLIDQLATYKRKVLSDFSPGQ